MFNFFKVIFFKKKCKLKANHLKEKSFIPMKKKNLLRDLI